MTRQRMTALTVSAAASSAIIMIAFFKAPVLPVGVGAAIAIFFLLHRKSST